MRGRPLFATYQVAVITLIPSVPRLEATASIAEERPLWICAAMPIEPEDP